MSLLWIRKNTTFVLYITAFGFIVMIFGVWGAQFTSNQAGRQEVKESAAATVYGQDISEYAYRMKVDEMIEQYRQFYGRDLDPAMREMLGEGAMDQLVQEILVNKEIDRLGLKALESEVLQNMRSTLAGENMELDQELLDRYSEDPRMAAYLDNWVRNNIKQMKLRQWMHETVKVTPAEAKTRYAMENDKVAIKGVSLRAHQYGEDVEPTEEMVQAYYDENTDEFSKPIRRNISYVKVSKDQFIDGIEANDDDVADYYDEHSEEYWHGELLALKLLQVRPQSQEQIMESKGKIDEARKRIMDGEAFDAVAKEVSEDPSAAVGGDIGSLGRDGLEAAYGADLMTAVFALKDGDLSEVIFSNNAFHILRIDGRTPQGYTSLDEVKDVIKEALIQERALIEASRTVRAIQKEAKENGWDSLAEKEDVTLEETKFFPEGRWIPELSEFQGLGDTAFSMKIGDISDCIESTQSALVFRVTEERVEGPAPLTEVKDEVEEAVILAEGMKKAAVVLAGVREKLTGGSTWENACAEIEDAEIVESEPFGLFSRFGSINIPEFPGGGEDLAKTAFLLEKGKWSDVVEGKSACYLFEVTSRDEPNWEEFDVAVMMQTVKSEKARQFEASWVESLRKRAEDAGELKILLNKEEEAEENEEPKKTS